jgi:glycerol uptake facilitator-like aquaporin
MFNPSVTTGIHLVRLKRGEDGRHLFNGWIQLFVIQCIGGFCGGLTGWFLGPTTTTRTNFPAPTPDETDSMGLARTFVAELIFTFALVSSVLNCAVSKKYGHAGNHFFGLAIGMTLMVGAMCVGPISGASFNPAVTITLQVVQCLAMRDPPPGRDRCGSLKFMYIYLLAELLGAYIAAVTFSVVSCEDHNADGTDPNEKPARDELVNNESTAFLAR